MAGEGRPEEDLEFWGPGNLGGGEEGELSPENVSSLEGGGQMEEALSLSREETERGLWSPSQGAPPLRELHRLQTP